MLGYTWRHLVMTLAAVLCVLGIVWIEFGFLIPAPPARITIAGSFVGGHFESLAHRYQEPLRQAHPEVDVRDRQL